MTNTSGWLQLCAAAVVTVGSLLGAAYFAQPSFARVPSLDMPGAIFVGVKQGSAPTPVRVDVDIDFSPSPTLTSFDIYLKGDVEAGVPAEQAGDLIIGFCGAVKNVQLRTTAGGENLRLEPLLPPSDTDFYAGVLGPEFSLDDCLVAVIAQWQLTAHTIGEGGIGWAVGLEGETRAATEAVVGAQHRYAFPRVGTLSFPAEILGINAVDFGIEAAASESVATLRPIGLPAEYVPTISSPQVEDLVAPAWGFPLRSFGRVEGFRLTGIDQRQNSVIQRNLFIASALAGTTGGGLIWLFGAVGTLLDNRLGKFRRAPLTEEAGDLAPVSANGWDVSTSLGSPTYRRLIAASVLAGVAGTTIARLLSRRKA